MNIWQGIFIVVFKHAQNIIEISKQVSHSHVSNAITTTLVCKHGNPISFSHELTKKKRNNMLNYLLAYYTKILSAAATTIKNKHNGLFNYSDNSLPNAPISCLLSLLTNILKLIIRTKLVQLKNILKSFST